MQSKTSFFNGALFRRNLQRFWPLWLFYAAVWFVLIPLIEAANLLWTNYRQNELAEETFRTARTIIRNATEGGGTVIIFIFAAFFAMALFSYLYQPRAVGMMHAIAVRRESLFVTNCVTGIFFFASSHLFIVICSAIVTLSGGIFDGKSLLIWFLLTTGEALLFFGFATLCAQFTGSIAALPVFYGILNFLAIAAEALVSAFAGSFLFGYSGINDYVLAPLSPLVKIMTGVSCAFTYSEEMYVNGGYIREINGYELTGGSIIAWYALVGVVLFVLSWLVYRARHSESAGDVVSVRWAKGIFKYGVGFCAAISLGQGLFQIFAQGSVSRTYASVVALVCVIVTGLVGFFIAEMLLQKSFRVFRTARKSALVFTAVLAASCFLICSDVTGYENRLPDAEEIEAVSVSTRFSDHFHAYINDEETIGLLLSLHKEIIDEKHTQRALYEDYLENYAYNYAMYEPYDYSEPEDRQSGYFTLSYYLADGSRFERDYDLIVLRDELSDTQTVTGAMQAYLSSRTVQQSFITNGSHDNPFFHDPQLLDSVVNIEVYSEEHGYESNHTNLNADQTRTVYDAIMRDLDAGNIGTGLFDEMTYCNIGVDMSYRSTVEDGALYEEDPWDGPVVHYSTYEYAESTKPVTTTANSIYVEVYAEMTHTLNALRACGVDVDGALELAGIPTK